MQLSFTLRLGPLLGLLALLMACGCSDSAGGDDGSGGDSGACDKPAGCAELCLDLEGDYCHIYQSMGNCAWSVEGASCDTVFCPLGVPEDGQYCSLETYVCSYPPATGGGGGGAGGAGGAGGEATCQTPVATCTATGWSVVCTAG